MEGNDAGRGIPPAVESPASIKGGCYNAGTLKRLRDKGRKTREAAQNLGERREPNQKRTEQRLKLRARGSGQRFHRDWCKAKSQPNLRNRHRDAGE